MASNRANHRRFLAQIEKEFETAAIKPLFEQRNRTARFVLKNVVEKTPVKTGLARGNYQVTTGQPSEKVLTRLAPDSTASIQAGAIAILNAPLVDMFIANNLHYINFLEEGTDRFPPFAMAADTVQEARMVMGLN